MCTQHKPQDYKNLGTYHATHSMQISAFNTAVLKRLDNIERILIS